MMTVAPSCVATIRSFAPFASAISRKRRRNQSAPGTSTWNAPVLVLPCLQVETLPTGNQAGLWGSLLPAVWSFMLAARARGLGTAWTTLHLVYEAEVAELLGLPDGIRQAALIPTAYYTGTDFRAAARQPLDEVVHWDHW